MTRNEWVSLLLLLLMCLCFSLSLCSCLRVMGQCEQSFIDYFEVDS